MSDDPRTLFAKTKPLSFLLDALESDLRRYLDLDNSTGTKELLQQGYGTWLEDEKAFMLLTNLLLLKDEIESSNSREIFGYHAFQISTRVYDLMLQPNLKYFEAGRKALNQLENSFGRANRMKQREAEARYTEIRKKFRKLLAAGVKRHKLVTAYQEKHPFSPSVRTLYRVKKTL